MKNVSVTKSHLLVDKVDTHLNMFGATMMHEVARKVHGRDVVAINEGDLVDRTRELIEKLSKLGAFINDISHCAILSINTGSRNRLDDQEISDGPR